MDVHKRTYSVALFCVTDGQVESWNCPADEAGLVEQLRRLGCRIEHIVYESGPTGFSLCRALRDAGFKASVIAASRIPSGAAAVAKSDRINATKLAIYCARGLLRPIAIPTIEDEGYRALVRRRKRLAETRAKLKQKIKGFLLAKGVDEPPSSKKWLRAVTHDLAALPLVSGQDSTLASMLREYRFLQEEHRVLRREIRKATQRLHPERYARLTQVGRVGAGRCDNLSGGDFRAGALRPCRGGDFLSGSCSRCPPERERPGPARGCARSGRSACGRS